MAFLGTDKGGGNVGSITDLVWPATVAAGQVWYIGWAFASGFTVTNPTGWTQVFNGTGSGSLQARILRRVTDGSEVPGAAISGWSVSTANKQTANIVGWDEVNTTNPEDGTPTSDSTHAIQPSHNCPAYTPTNGDTFFTSWVFERSSNVDQGFSTTGYTERGDTTNTTSTTGATVTAVADDGLATTHPAGVPDTPPDWVGDHVTGTANILTVTMAVRKSLTVHDGAAALSGSGTLSAVGLRTVLPDTALSGSGSLAAAGLRTVFPGATLSGQGDLSATALRTILPAAVLSGTGTLLASAGGVLAGAAALSGTGALAASAVVTKLPTVALSGAGALTAAAARTVLPAASLSVHGDLSAAPVLTVLAAASLSATGILEATVDGTNPNQPGYMGSGDTSARFSSGDAQADRVSASTVATRAASLSSSDR